MLFDRGIPDCIAYANHLAVDPKPAMDVAERYRYHPQVFLLEPWREINATDSERTMFFEASVSFHPLVVDAYTQLGYELVLVPQGAAEDRGAFVRRIIGSTARM